MAETFRGAEKVKPSSGGLVRFYDDRVHASYYPIDVTRKTPERYDRIVRAVILNRSTERVRILEIGSENPHYVMDWASKLRLSTELISCVDISSEVVKLLAQRGFQASQVDVATEDLPFETGAFDFVIMSEVLEHLTDADHALDEVHRVLKNDGHLILTTPNLAAWFNRVQLLAGFQPIFTETGTQFVFGRGPFVPVSRPVGHLQVYTIRSLRDLLRFHNFRAIHVEGLYFSAEFSVTWPLHWADRLAAKVPGLAAGILVDAAKLLSTHERSVATRA